MVSGDLDAVCAIARESFTVPWTREAFEMELQREYAMARVLRPRRGQSACGFSNFWIVGEQIHLHNIAVLPALRRRGYGRALLQDVLETGASRSVRTVILEVRRSNRSAVSLYRSMGFAKVGTRPRYYSDNGEDALLLVRWLGGEPEPTAGRLVTAKRVC